MGEVKLASLRPKERMQEALPKFGYRLLGEDGAARLGEIATPHGRIRTPAFMPVGTAGDRQGALPRAGARRRRRHRARQHLSPDAAARRGAHRAARRPARVHALGRPDPDGLGRLPGHVARQAAHDQRGGRALPVAPRRRDAHAHARARHRDPVPARRRHPDAARRVHRAARRAGRSRCARWNCRCAGRSARAPRSRKMAKPGQALFAIVQGGTDAELRRRSAEALVAMDFPGYAVGGLAVGEGQEVMLATLDGVVPLLPSGEAALPDGRRHAVRSDRARSRAASTCSTACCRRATAATASPTPGAARSICERPPRRGSGPARSGKHLPGRARLLARLPASPDQVGRAIGLDAAHVGEHGLLSAAHGLRCAQRSRRSALPPGRRRPKRRLTKTPTLA